MSTAFVGQIQPFAFSFAPRYWAHCNGNLLSIAQYNALYQLIGTIYGGDGRTTFALPDLWGRAPMQFGNGPGLSPAVMGEKAGQQSVTLLQTQMPIHNHTVGAVQALGTVNEPNGAYYAADSSGQDRIYSTNPPNTMMSVGMLNYTGGSQSHNNMQPFLAVNWCISLYGIYPSSS